jgi:hypothetical protein
MSKASELLEKLGIDESQKFYVYAPESDDKPHFQKLAHTTDNLKDAKELADKLIANKPHHTKYISVDNAGTGRRHFVDTSTKKWTSLPR